jgi:diguanylate cyclase
MVWYEYVGGLNAALTSDIDDRLAAPEPLLDDDAIARLFRQHIVPAGAEALAQIGNEMTTMMDTVAAKAAATSRQALAFNEQLDGLSTAIAAPDPGQLSMRLTEVKSGTLGMQAATDALNRQLKDSQSEIARLRSALDRAVNEALIDPLSGVLNRRGFDQQLAALVAEPTNDGLYNCLLLVDIDHFKRVNDAHGHLVGDRVIKALGDVLKAVVTDPLHTCARYGGEEFAVMFRRTPLERCASIAEAVRARIKTIKLRDRKAAGIELSVSISGGLAFMRPDDDASALIARADSALYRSKAEGRDRLTFS